MLPAVGGLSILAFAAISHSLATLIVGGFIAVAAIVVPFMTQVVQARTRRKRQAMRVDRYLLYLGEMASDIDHRAQEQREAGLFTHPTALPAIVEARDRLWERRLEHGDFLDVAIGEGNVPPAVPVRCDLREDANEFEPEAFDRLTSVLAQASVVPNAQAIVPLGRCGVAGVAGLRERACGLVRAILAELLVMCGPDELRAVAYTPAERLSQWEWLKWPPHCREVSASGGGSLGTPALSTSVDRLEELLEDVARPRLRLLAEQQTPGGNLGIRLPALVVLVDGFDPFGWVRECPLLLDCMRHAAEVGICIVCISDDPASIPSQAAVTVVLAEDGRVTVQFAGADGDHWEAHPRQADLARCDEIARALAPLRLVGEAPRVGRVDSDRVLDLVGVGAVDLQELTTAWAPRGGRDFLRVPIGSTPEGQLVTLDLKEAAVGGHGPHGLVVGATGSGKSELLRSIVVGLAATHSPESVNFVFADFKGGATFQLLDKLPHTAGMITNLQEDLSLVDRMRESLLGELDRRQRLLREVGRDVQKISEYNQLCDVSPKLERLPYLLVIVDEFGELLVDRPDFLDVFLSIGRTGRSLGVHLMLATQRLDSGAMKGLDTYLSYRACLRMFTEEESKTALGTRLAYDLPPLPGHGYFRTGESLIRFKSARVGLRYRDPSEEVSVGVGRFGDVRSRGSGTTEAAALDASDLGQVVRWVGGAWTGRRARKVWLDTLPDPRGPSPLRMSDSRVRVEEPTGENLPVPVGLIDLPSELEQPSLVYDVTRFGGHLALVGNPQTGKSTFLRTLVCSAAAKYSARDLQFCCVDFGGGLLSSVRKLPNVASVAGQHEPERVRRIFSEATGLVEERPLSFRDAGVESMSAWRRHLQTSGEQARYAHLVVAIDNYQEFRARFPDLEGSVTQIAVSGPNYGVHLVITSSRWADIRPAVVLDNIGTRFEFRLGSPDDSIYRRRALLLANTDMPGRGLSRVGALFQTADLAAQDDVAATIEAIAEHAQRSWPGRGAAPLRMLDDLDDVTLGDRLPMTSSWRPAVGIEERGFGVLHWDMCGATPHLLASGDQQCGKTTLLRSVIRQLTSKHSVDELGLYVVDYRRTLAPELADCEHLLGYCAASTMMSGMITNITELLKGRAPGEGTTIADLLAGSRWSGRRIVLVIDDYDLVVGSGTNTDLLNVHIAVAAEIGFHVALCQAARGRAGRLNVGMFKQLGQAPALNLLFSSSTPGESLPGSRRPFRLPAGRAYASVPNRPDTLVQTLSPGR